MGNLTTSQNVYGSAGDTNASNARKSKRRIGDLASKVSAEQEAALSPTARMQPAEAATWAFDHIAQLEATVRTVTNVLVDLQADHNDLIVAHDALSDRVEELIEAHNGLAADVETLETVPSRARRKAAEQEVASES